MAAIIKFENYLEKVKDDSEEFDEIADIIARYETLKAENKNLEMRTRQLEDQAEEVRLQTEKFIREKANEKLQINNNMGTFGKKCEQVNEQIAEFKHKAEEVMLEKLSERSKLAQINFAVFNLCQKLAYVKLLGSKSATRYVPTEAKPKKKEG